MERLEFLSGKYKDGERIVPGAVQTFQATEASAGRPVFVHRVPTTGPDAQNGLVRLLSSALLRSDDVRKLVIEVADENGFCYVVTQNAEQCLLLREWLQFEVERTNGNQAAGQHASPLPGVAPEKPAAPAEKPAEKVPGEFSRLFHVPQQQPSATPAAHPPSPVAPPAASGTETGEFTRFFRSDGLPAKRPAEPQRADHPSSSEGLRAARLSGAVQRPPNAPMTPLPQRPSDSVEMKRFLGDFRRTSEPAEIKRSASGEFSRLFSAPEKPSTPLPQPAPANEPGEYTRIFGMGNAAPPLSSAPSAPPEAPEKIFEGAPLPSAGEALPRGPSEYTQIIGRGAFSPSATPEPPAPALAPEPEAPPVAAPQIKLPPVPAMPAAPKLTVPKPPAVAVAAPTAGNQRLIIFLAIIGLLAVALVIAVVLLAKK